MPINIQILITIINIKDGDNNNNNNNKNNNTTNTITTTSRLEEDDFIVLRLACPQTDLCKL